MEFKFNPFRDSRFGNVDPVNGNLGGLEVRLAQKVMKRMDIDFYKTFEGEAAFLERATRKGVIGVPKLFGQSGKPYYAFRIQMEWISGKTPDTSDWRAAAPEEQIKARAAYIRTMANVIAHTGMIKSHDNKEVDTVIVNPSLEKLGDLVIIDWGPVTEAGLITVNSFLNDMVNRSFFGPSPSPSPTMHDHYEAHKLWSDFFSAISPLVTGFGDRAVILREGRQRAQRMLEGVAETPMVRLLRGFATAAYERNLDVFIQNLVPYLAWLDGVGQKLPHESMVRREEAYHQILGWTGSQWLQGGVDMKAAEPWIKHLDSAEETRYLEPITPTQLQPPNLQQGQLAVDKASPPAVDKAHPPSPSLTEMLGTSPSHAVEEPPHSKIRRVTGNVSDYFQQGYITVVEAAVIAGKSPAGIRRLAESQDVDAIRVEEGREGRERLLILKPSLESYKRNNTTL